jgi:PhnB protein
MSQFKPAGYNSVSPYLMVKNAAGTLAFLQEVFGVTVLRTYAGDNGRLRHAEVRLDDTVLMFADSAPEWPPLPSYVHIYVEDVDATYARALQAGGTSVQAPVKKDDEDKRGGVMDVGGTTWWIATRVAP